MAKSKNIFQGALVIKLIIAITLGIIAGLYLPAWVTRIAVTFSGIFGGFLSFVIPLMIIAFVTKGIADIGAGAGKLLGITVGIAYSSTLVGGFLSYTMAKSIFPSFLTAKMAEQIQQSQGRELSAYFSVPIDPFFGVTSAIVAAFMFGLCISILRRHNQGEYFYGIVSEFNTIIKIVLEKVIIPLLPFFIFGNFANLAYSGSVFAVMSVFWRIFLCIIILHLIYITLSFVVAGAYTGKNPFMLIKNQLRGYMTAVGTQSSAATIPVNISCAEKNGTSKEIRDFVIPLCATVHLPGSMITLTSCVYTILLMYNMPHSYGLLMSFVAVLGIAMVAAPGAPGGAVMSALPFAPMIGIPSTGSMASLLISLYLTQDSFGTAANVSCDNAIATVMDKIYENHIKGKETPPTEIPV